MRFDFIPTESTQIMFPLTFLALPFSNQMNNDISWFEISLDLFQI